jgi:hypothetical protein
MVEKSEYLIKLVMVGDVLNVAERLLDKERSIK